MRGPVLVQAPEPAFASAAIAPTSAAISPSAPAHHAAPPTLPATPPLQPVPPKDPFNRTAPAEGTPEYERWVFRQQITAVRLEIERLCGDYLSETAVLHSSMIEAWLNAGADLEDHIYPAVKLVVAQMAKKDGTIRGIGYFDGKVRELLAESRRLAAVAADPNPPSSAKRQYRPSGNGYGNGNGNGNGYGKPAKPASPVPAEVMHVLKMARQNGWDALHADMMVLLPAANGGDEESLRKLKDLAVQHGEQVLVPQSLWLSRKSSAA